MKILHTLSGKKRLLTLCTAALSVVLMNTSANADVYIDFGAGTSAPDTYGGAAGVAGVWNQINGLGSSSLNDSGTGEVSTAVVDLVAAVSTGSGPGTGNDDSALLDSYFFANRNNGSSGIRNWAITVSGLETGVYDVYYYAPSIASVTTGVITINGNNVGSLSGGSGLNESVSWGVLRDLDLAGGDTITFASPAAEGFRGLSGVQIIRAVPEPSTMSFLLLGVLGYVGRRRRS